MRVGINAQFAFDLKVEVTVLETNTKKEFEGKKWVPLGDSLTAGTNTSKCYFDYIEEQTGIKVYSMGVGGSGYMNDGAGGQAFYKRVNSIPTDADVVTIFGSGNDLSFELGNPTDTELNTICGCINNTITTLFRDFPLITLGIITPSPWASYNPANKENKMELYANALVEICKMRGIPCLDLYHCSGLRPWEEAFRALAYSKDGNNGVHPDETGHAIIAPRIKAFLRSLVV
jgi:lysophospholipase L1-like esterase